MSRVPKSNPLSSPIIGKAIADSSSVLLWISDVDKQCVYFNKAWLTYRGRTLEEEYGFGWADGVHSDDFDRCLKIYTDAFDAREAFSMVYRLKKSSGEYGWIQDDGTPYYDDSNQFLGFIGSCFEITETKRLFEALEAQTKELEVLNGRLTESIKAGHVGVWDWDMIEDTLIWDSEMYSIYGISSPPQNNSVELWESALHPEDKDQAISTLKSAIERNVDYELQFRIVRPDGVIRYIKGSGKVIKSALGEPIRMVGTNLDITAQHDADEKIRALEKRNRALLDYSPLCHKIVDLDFNLRYMNVNGFKMLSLPVSDDWFGQPYPFSFFPQQAQYQMKEKLALVVSTKERVAFEAFASNSKGDGVWLSHTIIPVFKEDVHELDYLTVVSADITHAKEMQEQLQHREKMEAIGQLAGGIAHDFNNQLASIMGYAQIMEMFTKDPDTSKYLGKIINATERSSSLTKQMLTFSRKQKLIKEPVDIDAQLRETVDMLSHSIDKRIEIKLKLDATKKIVFGNKSHLQNAFLNLGINAADAMNDSGQLIVSTDIVLPEKETYLRMDDAFEEKKYIKIIFEDNGEGIDEKNISKIFDPFFTTKSQGKGTGMGLASVYGAIKQHEGFIDVHSEVGIGTSFTLYLPIFDEHDISVERVQSTPIAFKAKSGGKVLVADDEAEIRALCSEFLSGLGYQVILAENGEQAVLAYKKHWREIDIVILDLMMPVLSGEDALKQIKHVNNDAKVIISSGYSNNMESSTLHITEGVEILEKPFKFGALVAAIKMLSET